MANEHTPAPENPRNESNVDPIDPSSDNNMSPTPAHARRIQRAAKEVEEAITPDVIER